MEGKWKKETLLIQIIDKPILLVNDSRTWKSKRDYNGGIREFFDGLGLNINRLFIYILVI